ncbi:CHAT domain-containing protein [Sphingobacterium sp. SGG-5]|uniref:CHAT domain-containing protein n=1 Tax=Sphingobacterium sp. SGG-5 TaxID=2710881 RepID=UPI0013EA9358|nr:CHAT domain-containing protein [Sphingobacterium sp. SGG-5]NGM60521.1 CHAT domain-containing protein [Sphingobacterium sp. SGG-5]
MGKYIIYLLCVLIAKTVLHCSAPTAQQSTSASKAISLPDSLFEYFESTADLSPEKYVSNPDSFLNSLSLTPQSFEQQEMYAYGLIFMAYGLREYGDHYNAIRYYEKVLNFIQSKNLKDINTHVYVIKPLAALYTLIDDNQKAINLLEQTLDKIPVDQYRQRVGFANNLANAYLYNQDLTKAKKLIEETLKKPTESLSRALLYNTLSTVYQEENDADNSTKYNTLALQEFAKNKLYGDTLIWYASALGQYGEIHHDYASGRQALQLLNNHFPDTQHRTKARLQLTLANILFHKNDVPRAKRTYQQVVDALSSTVGDEYTLDYTYTQALVGLARCFGQENEVDSTLHYFQWAIENDFRTQQLITSKRNQINNNIWNRAIIEEMSALIERVLIQEPTKQDIVETLLWCIELSKGRLLINEINRSEKWDHGDLSLKNAIRTIRHLHQKISQTTDQNQREALQQQVNQLMIDFQLSERYFETYNYSPDKASFFTHLNEPNKSYYSYFIHKDKTITVIDRSNDRYTYHKITDTTFTTFVQQFKDTYFGASPNSYNRDPLHYREQSHRIISALLPDLHTADGNICLSLDGQLYGLPFDALYEKGFLVNIYNFAYLNSFILYDLLQAPTANQTDITLLYRASFPKPLPDLKFVHEEVDNIGKHFKSEQIGPKNQNDSTIVQQFAGSHIIHIAAHTILDGDDNPIIYLQQPISTKQLRFYHIYSPMVFLSACNTGSGISLPSEGMESIQRVFLGKGVPSVISTYWFANDEAMLRLTSLFYQQLYESRKPVEALAQAKRVFLNEASIEHQNPWYWANINYSGINNEIGLRKNTNLSLYMGIGIVILLLILTGIYIHSRSNRSTVKKDEKSDHEAY